jgi:hypothetical protein
MKGAWITYSDEELAWIKACSDLPRAEMHALFVQAFGRQDVSQQNLHALCKRKGWLTGRTGRFCKGQAPRNQAHLPKMIEAGKATRFKPGVRQGVATRLYKPIGTERVTRDGYRERKINDDLPLQRRWRALHLVEWEAVNGPLPAGHALKCLDGDKTNTAPSNWACVPRALLPRLNGRFGRDYDTAPAELKPTLMAIAKLEHKAREARRAKANA